MMGSPVNPVVRRDTSSGLMSGSTSACEIVWNGGLVALCTDGAPFVLGCGIKLVLSWGVFAEFATPT